jgi:Phage portal protein
VKFLDALVPARNEVERYVPPAWMQPYIENGLPDGYVTSWGVDRAETISSSFADFAVHGLLGNAVIAAIESVRVAVFSEARFQFQQIRKGRPGDLFGTQDLEILERPWTGGTTGDLLARMLLDADLAGNSFWVEYDGEVIRLRPDWVEIALAPRFVDLYGRPTTEDDPDARQIGFRRVGYMYYEGGRLSGNRPAVYLPSEIVHYAPDPDPLANFRGKSWLTAVVREIQADTQATRHKLKFFENAASPNIAVKLPATVTADQFSAFVEKMDAQHKGVENAYKTLYTGGGADVTVIGADMRQMDFKVTQGAGETRLAAAGGVHPAIVALAEGLQGASLNAGNFGAARRLVADRTLRPLWRNAAGSLEVLVPPPSASRLWYDDRDVAFLREDAKDAAEIAQTDAQTIASLARDAGFTRESAVAAVLAKNMDLLVPDPNWTSVQLQPTNKAATNGNAPELNGSPVGG